jgi:hypothetical protein
MRHVSRFAAHDGKEFSTAEACREYEDEKTMRSLVGLKIETLRAIMARDEKFSKIADAIETLGNRIAVKRRSAGVMRIGGTGERREAKANVEHRLSAPAADRPKDA